ncbi:acyl-CoA dehydrogenase family protein [Brevibacterium sp. 91QC2O2]|uniref:acyl-CoA dehydrogenase family protein n=1 Tax=Brevibacterium TaxID=1696 RepID=UPI00211C094A|nr:MULTISPECIES: acyl-CoA dehydrogenase family protein [unclassified Brevibacterium]MCQ9368027.1 acyl-CoA dehydrogenase family protein [Brevibacterium sp. 91QC2O2]MCQ9385229.1 acyl-CoA dehydrogenase family protein [Brevibacterium sp. 68QC2CO]
MDATELDDVLATVRAFVREKIVPLELQIEEDDAFPQEIIDESAELGLFGWALPEEYGGLGMNAVQDAQLAFELGYTTPSFRSLFGTNNGIAGQVLVNYGTPEQKEQWLPRLASGEVVASFALTEPEAGSDPSGLRTAAVKRTATDGGSEYVINGSKRFITNAESSDVLMVFARTDPNAAGSKGISVFLVPTKTPGVTVGPHDHKMGQAGAWTSEIFFDDVVVPEANLIGGEEEKGFYAAMASLNKGRLHIGAICVGQAQRILDETVTYAQDAKQGGKSIARFELVQGMLADMYTDTAAARALVLAAAQRWDEETDRKLGPSSAKLFASEALGRVADAGVQVHGGMGYMRETTVERFYRHARLFRIYEGTSEVQRTVIARQLGKGAHKPVLGL